MKILILFCGGTLIMTKNREGVLSVPEPAEAIRSLLVLEPEISQFAEIDLHYIDNIDSTDMHPSHWDRMIAVISDKYDFYDGFVITHGTDTMAYTASALSFALQNLGKPIVITGSQIPGSMLETDARRNFVNSVKLATRNVSGVYIVFNERIVKGCRASKISESELDAFRSINTANAGKIKTQMVLDPRLPQRHDEKIHPVPGFEYDIMVTTLVPGTDPFDHVHLLHSKSIKGLVIQGFGTGNIPVTFQEVFETAAQVKIPVVVRSQCVQGQTAMKSYAVGAGPLLMGAIEAHDMSLESTVTKLMWALHHYPYEEIRRIMSANLAGELSI